MSQIGGDAQLGDSAGTVGMAGEERREDTEGAE